MGRCPDTFESLLDASGQSLGRPPTVSPPPSLRLSAVRQMAALLSLATITLSCDHPRSNCEVAKRRLEECDAAIRAPAEKQGYVQLPIQLTSCLGSANACLADCVADSRCPAITAVVLGVGRTDPNSDPLPPGTVQFSACLQTCIKLARGEN